MKKTYYLLMLVLLIESGSMAQITPATTLPQENLYKNIGNYYLQKSKSEIAAALIFLSGGILLVLRGALGLFRGHSKGNTRFLLFCLGAGPSFGSIPLFMTSEKSRTKAKIFLETSTNTHAKLPAGTMTVFYDQDNTRKSAMEPI